MLIPMNNRWCCSLGTTADAHPERPFPSLSLLSDNHVFTPCTSMFECIYSPVGSFSVCLYVHIHWNTFFLLLFFSHGKELRIVYSARVTQSLFKATLRPSPQWQSALLSGCLLVSCLTSWIHSSDHLPIHILCLVFCWCGLLYWFGVRSWFLDMDTLYVMYTSSVLFWCIMCICSKTIECPLPLSTIPIMWAYCMW